MKEHILINLGSYYETLDRVLDTEEFAPYDGLKIEDIEDIIDRLCNKIDELKDEIADIEQDMEDNYRRITKEEQYGED